MSGMMGGYWPGNMMGSIWGPVAWFMAAYWLISIMFILWALVSIAGSKKDAGYKLIWAGIAVFLGLIGVLVYYLAEKTQKTEKAGHVKESNERKRDRRR
jgi:uncharacterized membrane protein